MQKPSFYMLRIRDGLDDTIDMLEAEAARSEDDAKIAYELAVELIRADKRSLLAMIEYAQIWERDHAATYV